MTKLKGGKRCEILISMTLKEKLKSCLVVIIINRQYAFADSSGKRFERHEEII
ncbi:MAG: hypothetical protein ACYSWS_08320 [Planctomycetota bacterium]